MCCKKMLLLLLGVLWLSPTLTAQSTEKIKRMERAFKLQRTTEVNISNKYGNVHLLNWEKDSVKFEVEITVRSSKPARADKMFNDIDIQFSQSSYYVNAVSTFGGSGSLWSEITDVTKAVLSVGSETVINYTVHLPVWAKVKVENRFGNIYTTDHEGETEFKVANGSLQAHNLKAKTRIVVAFGSADLQSLAQGMVELNYADLELQKASALRLTSRTSSIHIEAVDELHLDSRRDKIILPQVKKISGDASFSRIEIGRLHTDMRLSLNYGSLSIEAVSNEIQSFQLTAAYTNIQLFLNKDQAAGIEIRYNGTSKVSYPPSLNLKDQVASAVADGFHFLKGTVGNRNEPVMKFHLTGGEINILQQ